MSGEPMKAGDFKPCKLCGKGMMHTGLPLFYRVTIERMGIDGREVQRTHGMEQFMGGHIALARVFHDPDLAKPVYPGITALVCEECAMKAAPLALLAERDEEKQSPPTEENHEGVRDA